MSRNRKLSLGLIICAVILIVAVAVGVSGIAQSIGMSYPNAEKYTAGDADISEQVKNLDIHWINGRVVFETRSGNSVTLRETSSQPIGPDLQLRWWLDGDTLRVQYAKPGFRVSRNQHKTLTVSLPEGIGLEDVRISATSGDLMIPGLKADTLTLNVTSGSIQAAAESSVLTVSATSGDMDLLLAGSAQSVTAGATSGNIRLSAEDAETVSVSTTSGDITLEARKAQNCHIGSTSGTITATLQEACRLDAGSTSGNIHLSLAKLGQLKVSATSGQVTAALPEAPGFTAKLVTTSGKINYSIPLSQQEKTYVCGDGSATVEIGTTSGNIMLTSVTNQP